MSRLQPPRALDPTVDRDLLLDALRRLAHGSRAHAQLRTRYRIQIERDSELRNAVMLEVAS